MDELVHTILSACMTCQACDKAAALSPAPLQPIKIPEGPFQHVIAFLTSVSAREGNLCTITTDSGPQFTSTPFADFLTESDINHIRTSVYHPQGNRGVELDILPPSPDGQYDRIRAKVVETQEKSALYTNNGRGAKPTKVTVGASGTLHCWYSSKWVRVLSFSEMERDGMLHVFHSAQTAQRSTKS